MTSLDILIIGAAVWFAGCLVYRCIRDAPDKRDRERAEAIERYIAEESALADWLVGDQYDAAIGRIKRAQRDLALLRRKP